VLFSVLFHMLIFGLFSVALLSTWKKLNSAIFRSFFPLAFTPVIFLPTSLDVLLLTPYYLKDGSHYTLRRNMAANLVFKFKREEVY